MAVRVYVVRHGKAEREAPSGLDADRALAARGHAQAAWLGARLAELEPVGALSPTGLTLLVSPIRRARETAAHLEAALRVAGRIEPRLSTDRRVSEVLAAVEEHAAKGDGPLVIVGHNPHFEGFASAMSGTRGLSMRTGEMVGLGFAGEVAPGAGEILGVWRLDED